MFDELKEKIKESTTAILPMVILILIINFAILVPKHASIEENNSLFGPVTLSLIIATVPLLIGTALFSIGAEKSVAKIGELVGEVLTKRKTIKLLLAVSFMMGFLATMAEPDLSVLSSRISPSGPDWMLILVGAIGVGIFLVVGILRVAYNKRLRYWFPIGYGIVFTLVLLIDPSFTSIVFDAGGVTTGVVTVPFILSLGMGVARVTSKNDADDDSFGFSGLCTLGTVLLVTIYAVILSKTGMIKNIQNNLAIKFDPYNATDQIMQGLDSYMDMFALYGHNVLHSIRNVAISMAPIVVFFVIFNLFVRLKGRNLYSIIFGFALTFIGLVLFFLGAETGFMPVATKLGKYFGGVAKDDLLLFILVGAVTGFISMLAEPAVSVLAKNVSEVSRGAISKNLVLISLCIATSISIFLNIIRIRYNIEIVNFLVPLIIIAIVLSLFSKDMYIGIAIDSAGVATGTMASCFFLPMSIGYVSSFYVGKENFGSILMANGFGIIGIMSIMPIITLELIGAFGTIKETIVQKNLLSKFIQEDDVQVIHLPLSNNLNEVENG